MRPQPAAQNSLPTARSEGTAISPGKIEMDSPMHWREPEEEHPGVAVCSIPDNSEGITPDPGKVTCPRCLALMQSRDVAARTTSRRHRLV